MLCQNETGVLSGSEIYFNTVGTATRRLFYYINSCGHYYCETGYKIRRNHMDSLLLLMLEQGTMRVEYKSQKYTAHAGDIVLLDGSFAQYYDTPDYAEFYWMHLAGLNSFDLCEHLTASFGTVVHSGAHAEQAAPLVRFLVSQFTNNQPIIDSAHSRLLHSILCYLMPDTQIAAAGGKGPVQEAVNYIQLHLGEDLSLRRLSEEVHFSPSHLIRLFRAETQHSPHEYIVLLRMDRAKYLLKTTSMPIKAIADAVGYRTESSFTCAFTEKIGISPRRFREMPLG